MIALLSHLSPWWHAIRPKTLPASMGPVIIGTTLSYHYHQKFDIPMTLTTLAAAISLQIAANLVNDFCDFKKGIDHQGRIGPTRVSSQGLINEPEMKKGIMAIFFLAFLLGIWPMAVGGKPIIILGITSLIFAFLYTGGPFPLSYFALGEILALIFFGPVAVWGSYFLQFPEGAYHPISTQLLLVGGIPGFLSASIMSINNLRDFSSDKNSGKITLSQILGIKFASLSPLFFQLSSISCILLYSNLNNNPKCLLALVPSFFHSLILIRIIDKPIDKGLNDVLAKSGKYLFLVCLTFSFGLLL